MKALVYTGTGRSELRDLPEPAPGPGLVVVTVAACGICGSDMHAWHGRDPRRVPPLVLGHEAAGVALDGIHAGRRVAINPLMTCGTCPPCRTGRVHLCPERSLLGLRVPGAFAERVAVAEANLSPLPDGLADADAALAEPLACAVHAVRLGLAHLAAPAEAIGAAVLGGGAIGLLAALVLAERGVARIALAETNPGRARIVAEATTASAYDPREPGTGPAAGTVDLVIDAVGSGATRRAASALAAPGGAIVHVGLEDSAEGLDSRRLTLQEIAFLGSYCYTPADFAEALGLLAAGRIRGAGWVVLRPLAEGARAFEDIDGGRAGPKIILAP